MTTSPYYDALTTAWNSITQPPVGVTGTGLNNGMTTTQKLAAINGWTVTGSIPTTMTAIGVDVLNCVVWSEFAALTPQQQSNFLMLCSTQGQLLGGSANLSKILPGMIIAYFGGGSGTVANLSALAKATTQTWAKVNGYPNAQNGGGGITDTDLANAGGLA